MVAYFSQKRKRFFPKTEAITTLILSKKGIVSYGHTASFQVRSHRENQDGWRNPEKIASPDRKRAAAHIGCPPSLFFPPPENWPCTVVRREGEFVHPAPSQSGQSGCGPRAAEDRRARQSHKYDPSPLPVEAGGMDHSHERRLPSNCADPWASLLRKQSRRSECWFRP